MSRALIIVDAQPTFCEGGELGIDGGDACIERVAEYVENNHDNYDLIVTTQDWHIDPGDHFSDNPDFVDTWPPHGVAGTKNAELHPALNDVATYISHADSVKKGHYTAAYSGFEGETEDGRSLSQVLKDHNIDTVDVVGLALSHCVCDTSLDAIKEGLTVRCLRDLTEPTSKELGDKAVEKMTQAGVTFATSK